MFTTVFDATTWPSAERFTRWCAMADTTLMPTRKHTDHADDFHATAHLLDLGAVRVARLALPQITTRRTAALIARGDPGQYQLMLALRGDIGLEQHGRTAVAGPGQMILCDSSRPFRSWMDGAGEQAVGLLAQFPKALLPLGPRDAERLLAARVDARGGVGALYAGFLTRLGTAAAGYRADDAPRLGGVLLDLATALLAHEAARHNDDGDGHRTEDRGSGASHTTQVARIDAFIETHLADPELTPAAIAAAHHISVRSLHRAFQKQGRSVGAWIRTRRLQRCRRDLADPALADLPVHRVAARWGFTRPADFTRAFRAAYGMTPSEFREAAAPFATAGRH